MKGSLLSAGMVEPYAEALMSLAQEHELTERFGEDVAGLLTILQESPDLQNLLGSPVVKAEDKKAILQGISNSLEGDQLHPYMISFLNVLVDRRRILFLEGVIQEYQALLRKLKQTVLAEVTSAVSLTDEQHQSVREKVKEITSASEVELDTKIDPELIGGVIIKVGSQVIDSSLRGQLRRIGLSLNAT
ncbi:MAG: F0F1 ATP synthase subunit delta [Symploca sp. SIO1C2]|nr:F0F1 ATP synthase subunit delta [Symploca sp. SIO1C2]NER49312.1 F0F1 ATP synthase subunit delta [Symploca sp. SIO1A3]